MEKISLTADDNSIVDFYILDQQKLFGKNYLLVTDAPEGDASALILKDMSSDSDAEASYVIVEDDTELAACTITAGAKKLINDFRRNVGFTGKNSIHAFLDLPSLLCSRRQVRKGDDWWNRKSRGC